jgi:hypothetical protein
MISLMGGGTTDSPTNPRQLMNIDIVQQHYRYLRSLPFIDPAKIVLSGHSAGGGVTYEACGLLSACGLLTVSGEAVLGWVGVDPVGWPRTHISKGEMAFKGTKVIVLRSDPNAWNKKGDFNSIISNQFKEERGPAAASSAQCLDVYLRQTKHGDPTPLPPGCLRWMLGKDLSSMHGPAIYNRWIDLAIEGLVKDSLGGRAQPLAEELDKEYGLGDSNTIVQWRG